MSFLEHRAALDAAMERLEAALRDALVAARTLEKRVADATGETETLRDDAALARFASTAKRARQDLTALARLVQGTTETV